MQLHELERAAGNKEEIIASMQKVHQEQLQKLASIAEERSQQWQQQKTEMEAHYTQLMKEVQSRQKVTV